MGEPAAADDLDAALDFEIERVAPPSLPPSACLEPVCPASAMPPGIRASGSWRQRASASTSASARVLRQRRHSAAPPAIGGRPPARPRPSRLTRWKVAGTCLRQCMLTDDVER